MNILSIYSQLRKSPTRSPHFSYHFIHYLAREHRVTLMTCIFERHLVEESSLYQLGLSLMNQSEDEIEELIDCVVYYPNVEVHMELEQVFISCLQQLSTDM